MTKIRVGIFVVRTAAPTIVRKKEAPAIESELFIRFVFIESRLPGRQTFTAQVRPLLSEDREYVTT